MVKKRADKLEHAPAHEAGSGGQHAKYFPDAVVPAMASLRDAGDALEVIMMPRELWLLAAHREMLSSPACTERGAIAALFFCSART